MSSIHGPRPNYQFSLLQAWSTIEAGLCRALSSYVTNNFNRTGRARPLSIKYIAVHTLTDLNRMFGHISVSFSQGDPMHGHCPVKEGERRNEFFERACQSKA